ncbi:MAG TPA: tRNA (adenosine(37)-N6)-threonylcarbamoyltransferase complex dimerization subunit type 1 TsaB [Candidatus Dorea intestinavium]|nr:tRNA (adenosine(37)-N6)-threonylcarbamoyltransferase complex dimerization subunit type 1 TsaB [Candidatus Dorea intestinavium]
MRILAIDSSSLVAGIAVVEDDKTIVEYNVNYKKTHSQTLLPMLEEVKKMTELDLESLDYIAVSKGPGSFTGLRIGAATAKGLGLALKKEIIAIPTLEGLAYNLLGTNKLVCPIMDARRNQVYTGIYKVVEEIAVVKDQDAMDIHDLIKILNELEEEVVFLGDGVPVFKEVLKKELTKKPSFAPPHLNRQRAASYGALALVYAKNKKVEEAAMFRPDYLRKSQAERERVEAENGRTKGN